MGRLRKMDLSSFFDGDTHEQVLLAQKRWHDQLLNKAACQGKTCPFVPYTRANKTS